MESVIDTKEYEDGITLSEFRNLVVRLGPAELANLPIDALPDNIPQDILNSAPEQNKSVLEEILFELNSREVNLRLEFEEQYGPAVADAYDLSKAPADTPAQENFRIQISELLVLHKKAEAEQSRYDKEALFLKIRGVDPIVSELRSENAAILKGKHELEKRFLKTAGHHKNRFASAIKTLTNRSEALEIGLGRYYYLRLVLVVSEMHDLEERVRLSHRNVRDLQLRIDDLHEQLGKTKKSFFGMNKARQRQRDQYKEEINTLLAQRQAAEVMISETDLTNWLDIIVDGSVTPKASTHLRNLLKRARMLLYDLLQQYCHSQEEAALQVAKNPFTQADPESAIKFMLYSEQFILDYFSNKKGQLVNWLGDAAHNKVEQIGNIERELLRELKKNNKLAK